MAETHDFLALDWVRGEIEETLKQAQQALEAFVENPEDQTRLRFCLTHLHQVYGTLQMVEFYGAALLAEEMEKLVQAMLAGQVPRMGEAQETLMRGMLQLPPYLDRIKASRRDMPVVLLPLLNDIRAARGEKLLSEGALFKPDMAQAERVAGRAPAEVSADPHLAELLRKLRQMFQLALLGVIRGESLPVNVGYMAKVSAKLDRISGESPVSPLWKVVSALVEGVSNASIDNSTAVKLLLGQVDRVIRALVEQGAKGFEQKPPADLFKNLLFYVARSNANSPLIRQVKEAYRLDEALLSDEALDSERAKLSGPDRQTMATVANAISEELVRVKEALDIFMRGEDFGRIGELAPHLPTLRQVADTLAMLGLGQQRKLVLEQHDLLDGMIRTGKLDDPGRLMDMAGALLYVEATLASQGTEKRDSDVPASPEEALTHDEIGKAFEAVLRECHAGLEFAKEKIVEYIASQWAREHIEPVPESLTSVRGGLQLVGQDRAAAVLVKAVEFIRRDLLRANAAPDWKRMDTLADAISSVEYFLERAVDDASGSGHILDIAEKAVADLGYPVTAMQVDEVRAEMPGAPLGEAEPVSPPEAVALPDEFTDEFQDEPLLDVPMTSAEESKHSFVDDEPALIDTAEEVPEEVGDEAFEELVREKAFDVQPDEGAVLPGLLEPSAWEAPTPEAVAEVVQEVPAVAAEPVAAGPVGAGALAEEDAEAAEVDEEIVEIFVEEIGEVMEKLDEYFPQWAANQQDEESLKEFRRAFHTLKGSGRMVGARYVGELAWSVENMLNRVIDKTVAPTPVMIDLIRAVKGIVPELVDAFARRKKPPYAIESLMECANAMSRGESPKGVPPLEKRGAKAVALQSTSGPVIESQAAEPSDLLESVEAAGHLEPVELLESPEETALAAGLPVPELDETVVEELPLDVMEVPSGEFAIDVPVLSGETGPSVEETSVQEEEFPEDLLLEAAGITLEELPPVEEAAVPAPEIDLALIEVFSAESEQHLDTIDAWLAELDPDLSHYAIPDEVLRAMHTLKGSARMAGIFAVSDIAGPAEKFCKEMRNNGEMADYDVVDLIRDAAGLVRFRISHLLPDPFAPIPGAEAFLARLSHLQDHRHAEMAASAETEPVAAVAAQAVQPKPGLINDLLAEGIDHVLDGADHAAQWSQQGTTSEGLDAMCAECARLEVVSREGGILPLAALAGRLSTIYGSVRAGRLMLSSNVVGALQEGHEAIVSMMDSMAALQSVWPATSTEQALDEVIARATTSEAQGEPARKAVGQGQDGQGQDGQAAPVPVNMAQVFGFDMAPEPEVPAAPEEQLGFEVLPEAELSFESVPEPEPAFEPVTEAALQAEETQPGEQFVVADEEVLAGEPATDFGFSADELEMAEMEVIEASGTVEPMESDREMEEETPPETAGGEAVEPPGGIPDRDPELVEIFLEEADEIVESAATSLETWIGDTHNTIEVQKLQRDLHTLKGGARMAEIAELGNLAHELENLYEGLSHGTLSATEPLFDLLHRCHDRIADMVGQIRSRGWCRDGDDLIAQIHAYIRDPNGFVADVVPAIPSRADEPEVTSPEPVPAILAELPVEPVTREVSPPPAAPVPSAPAVELASGVDPEILEIFLEEAEDLSSQLDGAIAAWKSGPNQLAHADELKRVLHTLKGGARLAGLKRLGDLSHHFETRVIDRGGSLPDDAFFAEISGYHDEIALIVEQVRSGGAAAAIAAAAQEAVVQPATETARAPAPEQAVPPSGAPAAPPVPVAATPARDEEAPRSRAAAAAARQAQPQEMVKVPADLLEKLVNLAGETSINRARIEQQTNDFRYSLQEMGSTISRLAEQLRRLNAEADEQVKANWEAGKAEGKHSGDFDPLEMDQYSQLHQLTKQLFESASDLLDIRDTLVSKSRDAETLLLQQSRVNTELQEGLMRSRMVPFSRLIPRLRRIVRQVSGELKKNIEIDFINPEGELDRALLERMVAPLEHMLRNACDHGVEAPDVRVAAGKPAQGRVRLALSREGGEVVLTIADDGKGVNVDAVRRKAIDRGMMDDSSDLSDQEVMQFILEAGFSTAEKVTQISGRGVGMDVVSSEIKQMGGTLSIRSAQGQGTTFEIRLPFTVSVNRALMVRVGEDQYAIPLSQIEGIVRVSPYELEAYFEPDAPPFDYAGEHYRLQYLGGFVHGGVAPNLSGLTMPLPVLLVRGADHSVAIQVDQLIGSREVVVKAVGPQLSTVAGISGATILGDGRVVIILDLMSLVRASHLQNAMLLAQQRRTAALQAAAAEAVTVPAVREIPLIMVTDDSVTVRKVTGRFLERQGFEVITAKDGMDAVAQLGDVKPDLMLLDIEMPRMDGFEVASHCRHDSRLKDLPIIMITSRTGEKHRERAFDIGVNAYLGKPFQESELLAKINELLGERRAKAAN